MNHLQDLLDEFQEIEKSPLSIGFDFRIDLAEIILRHLGENGMTQKKLANALGMKEPQLSRIIHIASNCTFETAGRILQVLGVKAKIVEIQPAATVSNRNTQIQPKVIYHGKTETGAAEIYTSAQSTVPISAIRTTSAGVNYTAVGSKDSTAESCGALG